MAKCRGRFDSGTARPVALIEEARSVTTRHLMRMSAIPIPATVTAQDRLGRQEWFLAWLRWHGIDTARTFRVDIGVSAIMVHQWAFDKDGHKYIEPGTDDCAIEAPFTVPMRQVDDYMVKA